MKFIDPSAFIIEPADRRSALSLAGFDAAYHLRTGEAQASRRCARMSLVSCQGFLYLGEGFSSFLPPHYNMVKFPYGAEVPFFTVLDRPSMEGADLIIRG